MRFLLIVLVALAVGKVGTQAYIRQQSIENTVIAAYRAHAIAACEMHGASQFSARQSFAYAESEAPPDVAVELAIGRSDLNVRLWQTSSSKWSQRYADPFLIVHARTAEGATACEYDIRNARILAFDRTPASGPDSEARVSQYTAPERHVRR